MLVLSRKTGESIVLAGNIKVYVLGVENDRIKLGIDAPPDVLVLRSELLQHEAPYGADPAASQSGPRPPFRQPPAPPFQPPAPPFQPAVNGPDGSGSYPAPYGPPYPTPRPAPYARQAPPPPPAPPTGAPPAGVPVRPTPLPRRVPYRSSRYTDYNGYDGDE